jgi:NAD+ synthase (glutamine-hydrolysing)
MIFLDSKKFYEFGFLRVAAVSPKLYISHPRENVKEILSILETLEKEGVQVACFPELCLTGYSVGDLFFQSHLLEEVQVSLLHLIQETKDMAIVYVLGFPYLVNGRLYNCAGLISKGEIYGIIAKTYLPNTYEFYEHRWFTSGLNLKNQEIILKNKKTYFGTKMLFALENTSVKIGIEICEDLWAVEPPSGKLALTGANLIFNLSASPETLGKSDYRYQLVSQQSARCNCAYVYSSSGAGESTTDLVYSGHCLIAENGIILNESRELSFETKWIISDIDIQKLNFERIKNKSFGNGFVSDFQEIPVNFKENDFKKTYLLRKIEAYPFVPNNPEKRKENCKNIFSLQTFGLAKRVLASKSQALILGVSGGLDSTLAVLVAYKALIQLGYPLELLKCFTLPGFGTTTRTKANAIRLVELLGGKIKTISIVDSVLQHFRDIEHDPNLHDLTYENAQARERTQVLMDIANKLGGIVVGTGDLSELALGWCTYNADQMSMYNVNSGIPKTLVRYVIEYCAEYEFEGELSEVLKDICNTPITPELLPSNSDQITQKTEEIIGSYVLHDFFLYNFLRLNYSPKKIFFLALIAFTGQFEKEIILQTLKTFYKRFFSNQFKRSAMPDGIKIGSVALSPRADWRMPSDAEVESYLQELDEISF